MSPGDLRRRLGLGDAVVVGLSAMVGAGIFAALGPATAAAGRYVVLSLVLAAVVAAANATSSARLATRYPRAGGGYVWGRERLGETWGFLAGWAFVVGKTASCAAMALTVGAYAWPGQEHLVAVVAVVLLTALGWSGVQRSAAVARWVLVLVLAALTAVVVVGVLHGQGPADVPGGEPGLLGVWQGAALLFFAFAGYARIATLGEEVRDPERTLRRAIPLALAAALLVYAAVLLAVLAVLGVDGLAGAVAPLADAVRVAGASWLVPVVGVAAAAASLGALLSLLLGVSRVALAMARDRRLPAVLATVAQPSGVPRHAELAVGVVVAVLAATVDVRGAIGFSSFGVLVYYAIANAAALTLRAPGGWRGVVVPVVGLLGCTTLALALPVAAVVAGLGVLGVGLVVARATRGRAPAG